MPQIEIDTTTDVSKWCKVAIWSLSFLLSFSPFIIGGVLFFYSFFYGFAGVIVSYILTGIVLSKIRVSSLDMLKNENGYKTYDLVKLYFYKNYC